MIRKNWPKYLLQWGVLAALVLFLSGLIPSKEAADPEAYCPLGGLQALATYPFVPVQRAAKIMLARPCSLNRPAAPVACY